LIKADLHIHTAYSMDCAMSLEQVIARCLEVGINCLAVADHNTIAGALKLKEMAPFPIIIAEEILTSGGELIGLFLSQEIPSKLSIEETTTRIKAQGGLVCIPHPYDRLRLSIFRNQTFEAIIPEVDIVEVFNARSLSPHSSAKAWQLAHKYGKLASAGSDAHTPSEIGNAYVEMPEFSGKDEFLASLAKGKISGNKSNPVVHFASTWARLKRRLS
jgi:predicted metal-dependent phosphoesterase TrpH